MNATSCSSDPTIRSGNGCYRAIDRRLILHLKASMDPVFSFIFCWRFTNLEISITNLSSPGSFLSWNNHPRAKSTPMIFLFIVSWFCNLLTFYFAVVPPSHYQPWSKPSLFYPQACRIDPWLHLHSPPCMDLQLSSFRNTLRVYDPFFHRQSKAFQYLRTKWFAFSLPQIKLI